MFDFPERRVPRVPIPDFLEQVNKNGGRALKAGWMIPRSFGLRQSSAAFASPALRKSGRGLPQSKTLTRSSFTQALMVATDFLKPV
jgi:hypothetical protein